MAGTVDNIPAIMSSDDDVPLHTLQKRARNASTEFQTQPTNCENSLKSVPPLVISPQPDDDNHDRIMDPLNCIIVQPDPEASSSIQPLQVVSACSLSTSDSPQPKESGAFKCFVCQILFDDRDALTDHVDTVHNMFDESSPVLSESPSAPELPESPPALSESASAPMDAQNTPLLQEVSIVGMTEGKIEKGQKQLVPTHLNR